MTYVIDYKKKLVKKFNNKELKEFLNYSYIKKNRFIFVNNKKGDINAHLSILDTID
jgi:hypothetical protein